MVHGGKSFTAPTVVDDAVLAEIERLIPVAPLHNPANLIGIRTAQALRPDLPQVAVFDTAFHTTMPESAARYAIDVKTADEHRIRRYGFHGTSHAYVSRETARLLGKAPEDVNVIVLHLGNGASASAVRSGRCVDTSMGLTPLEGLVMGTRSGDMDPAVIFHLTRVGGMSTDEIDTLLNKKSGLIGLCGDNDMREIRRRVDEGDEQARLAFDIYIHRLKKYIGAYYAVLGRVDAIAFTAGVGENAAPVREAAVAGLEELGLAVDSRPERGSRGRAPARLPRGRAGRGRRGADRRGTGDRHADLRTRGRVPRPHLRGTTPPRPGGTVPPHLSGSAPLCIFRQTEYSVAKQTDRIALCAVRKSSVLSAPRSTPTSSWSR